MNGTVKFFNQMKGFGFIAGEDGTEYFVHQTGLKEGVTINDEDPVTFDVEQGDKGPKAVNVGPGDASEKPVEEAAAEEEATEEPVEKEAKEEAEEK